MLPEDIIATIAPFTLLFSRKIWIRAQLLMIGAILCQGQRTVAAILTQRDQIKCNQQNDRCFNKT